MGGHVLARNPPTPFFCTPTPLPPPPFPLRHGRLSDGSFVGALEGHGGGVWDLASTSDGGRLYSASNDMSLREWDVATGECTAVLEDHTAGVYTASLNGNLLVSGGGDSAVKVWDVRTQTCERTLSHHSMVVSAVQYDGVKLISASLDTTICSWDIGSGRVVRTYEGHTYARSVAVVSIVPLAGGGSCCFWLSLRVQTCYVTLPLARLTWAMSAVCLGGVPPPSLRNSPPRRSFSSFNPCHPLSSPAKTPRPWVPTQGRGAMSAI